MIDMYGCILMNKIIYILTVCVGFISRIEDNHDRITDIIIDIYSCILMKQTFFILQNLILTDIMVDIHSCIFMK